MSTYLEIERKKQLDLLARAVYGWPDDGSRRTYSVAALVEAIGELRIVAATPIDVRAVAADAQALADVRTLDEWAVRNGEQVPSPRQGADGLWYVGAVGGMYNASEDSATPDEARAKAAAWAREHR